MLINNFFTKRFILISSSTITQLYRRHTRLALLTHGRSLLRGVSVTYDLVRGSVRPRFPAHGVPLCSNVSAPSEEKSPKPDKTTEKLVENRYKNVKKVFKSQRKDVKNNNNSSNTDGSDERRKSLSKLVAIVSEDNFGENEFKDFILAHPTLGLQNVEFGNFINLLNAIRTVPMNVSRAVRCACNTPGLIATSYKQVEQTLDYLRRKRFNTALLTSLIANNPAVLTTNAKTLTKHFAALHDECQFSNKEIIKIVQNHAAIFDEEPDDLVMKFQYAYFRMEIREHKDLVDANFFAFPMEEIVARFKYLVALGLYSTSDKVGIRKAPNPRLREILIPDERSFARKIANTSVHDYRMFRSMLRQSEDRNSTEDDDEETK